MSKSVLISIKPKWCELIANGKKTVEVRKTKPKLKPPFKCYIYCTKDKNNHFWTGKRYSYADDHSHNAFDKGGNGKVIGEFVCDRIDTIDIIDDSIMTYIRVNQLSQLSQYSDVRITAETCLNIDQLQHYLDEKEGYGWHISDLKIYDEPQELSEFEGLRKTKFGYEPIEIKRPPQSWCYVEECE
jgi:predicted transcriptional regulator